MEYTLSAILRARDAGFSATVKKAQEQIKTLARGVKGTSQSTLRLNVEGIERVDKLKAALQSAGMSTRGINVGIQDRASARLEQIRGRVNSLAGKAHNVIVNIKTNGAESLKRVKGQISELASGAAMGMGASMLGMAGIGYGVVNAFQSQMDFEKQMSAVKAVSNMTQEEFLRVQSVAEKMGETTKFTAKESADALYYMSMAGWKTEQQVAGLPAVLHLAAAGNAELGTTADIVTDSMTAFGIKAGQMIRYNGKLVEASGIYSDMMAALVTNANTDISGLGEALKYIAPNIGAMYANGTDEQRLAGVQDTLLITGLMANAGIKNSQAGTTARSLFARLGAQNRNADFALQALGVDFKDENGEVRRMRDLFGDLRARFKEGISADKLIDFAEQLEGTKLHADTRRKLEGFLESAQKNGGKMPGSEMLKMAAMLNGQEGMSGLLAVLTASEEDWNKLTSAMGDAEGTAERISKIQLDNLAGDFTYLGSAWDAFQRSMVSGDASAGLRGFVQTVTSLISKANTLFKDGIQIGDIFTLIGDAVKALKDKFLQLDGIGSILAGGALMMGLKKILSTALTVKDTLSSWSKIKTATDLGEKLRGRSQSTMSSVGTMNVKAGVVNISGAVNQRAGQQFSRQPPGTTGRAIPPQNQPPPSQPSRMATAGKAAAGGLGIAAVFGALDVLTTKSQSEYSLQAADAEIRRQESILQEYREQGAEQFVIDKQIQAVEDAKVFRQQTVAQNELTESKATAGAIGAAVGTAAGAAIGSAVPVIGTMVGGMVGGVVGEYVGANIPESAKAPAINQTFENVKKMQQPEITIPKMPDFSELLNFELPNLGISEKLQVEFDNVRMLIEGFELPNLAEMFSFEIPELGLAEKFQAELENAQMLFEGFRSTAASVFEGLSSSIQGSLANAQSAITSTFTNASAEVQAIWGAIPGFFSGIFGSLGGIAAGAGAAIAAGINSGIGMIQSAWEALSGWLSSKIASIASMASSAASAVGFSIGSNATGTSNFAGGWSEVNEHGGELMYLPQGTRIVPHSTTVNILKHEIQSRLNSGELPTEILREIPNNYRGNARFKSNGNLLDRLSRALNLKFGFNNRIRMPEINKLPSGINPSTDILTSPGVYDSKSPNWIYKPGNIGGNFGNVRGDELPLTPGTIPSNAEQINNTTTSTSTSRNNINLNFGGVNITNGMDFDNFAHRLVQMLSGSIANSVNR